MSFAYTASPARIVFGAGTVASLAGEVERLGARRALVITSPGQSATADQLSAALAGRSAGTYPRAIVHVPSEVAAAARAHALAAGADAYVAFGGGSAIGLAKALALSTGAPIIAIPTTFSGSEATPIHGMTEGNVKRTGRDPRVLPRVVIYDPELFATLPAAVAGPSGVNAIAHAVEALYAVDGNPAIDALAESAVRLLAGSLERLGDPTALVDAVTGAWLAGTCLGSVAMALHHKLCHALGGAFDLPHAETHAIVLPHVVAFNAPFVPSALSALSRALGSPSVAAALFDLRARLGAPASLAALGVTRASLSHITDLAIATPYANPRPVDHPSVLAVLESAFDGHRPTP